MYMSLVNPNQISEVISAAEILEFCRVRTCTCTNQYDVSQFRVFLFVFSFVFVFKLFFLFSKVLNLKDRLDFYHLSHKHKLICLFA